MIVIITHIFHFKFIANFFTSQIIFNTYVPSDILPSSPVFPRFFVELKKYFVAGNLPSLNLSKLFIYSQG